MVERSGVNVAAADCPECGTLLALHRPCQAETFRCPACDASLRVSGGFVVTLTFRNATRLHRLT